MNDNYFRNGISYVLCEKTSFFVLKVCFLMFKLFRPDFKSTLLSLQKLPFVKVILKNWAHFFIVIL